MILEQFSKLKIARFEIVLQAQTETVLPALIGSTLRGAFGHALKAISCSMPHGDCEKCFLSRVCNYTTVFEPTANGSFKDIPRPFVFEPPVPPLTKEISGHQTLKIHVPEKGKISFGLILLGEAIEKLPFIIYAFELMARHGFGAKRQPFSVAEVFQIHSDIEKNSIYTPQQNKILPFRKNTLTELIKQKISVLKNTDSLKIRLQTPLRIRQNRLLLKKLDFQSFFKSCSLRLKFLAEIYGFPLDYDYRDYMKKAGQVGTLSSDIWEHESSRRSNRQERSLETNGLLGEIAYANGDFSEFILFAAACEILHIGSSSSFGFGKFQLVT